MHTLSSASRTCIASASAVEWTATVEMPSSRHARWMRNAISPRLAIRIFSNTFTPREQPPRQPCSRGGRWAYASRNHQQDFAILDRLGVAHQDVGDRAGAWRRHRVHHLHGLDDQQRLALAHRVADLDER